MRFNSVKRGNFSGLARSVNQNADAIFRAARDTAVNHTQIAKASIDGRSVERRAAMKAEGEVAQAGLKAFTKVKDTKNKIESAEKIADIKRPAKRMAGIVGGLGAIASGAVMMQQSGEDKADREELRGLRNEMDAKRDAADAESEARYQKFMDSYFNQGNDSTDPKPSAPVSQQSGATPIKTSTKPTSISSKVKPGKSAWGALSSVIRGVEGTSGDRGYTTRFGGAQFSDMSKHPNIKAPTPWGTSSEAAGAYQFMKPTWDEAKAALGLTDFSPESQEKAGRFLTQRRGVDPDKQFTTFEGFSSAISKLSPEWAGLPNSEKGRTGYHGQANADMQELWKQYQNYFN